MDTQGEITYSARYTPWGDTMDTVTNLIYIGNGQYYDPATERFLKVPRLSSDRLGESSEVIRQRVESARRKQRECFSNIKASSVVANAEMRVGEIRQFCKLDEAGEGLIRAAIGQMNLSARGYHRVLKLARTIADLVGSNQI